MKKMKKLSLCLAVATFASVFSLAGSSLADSSHAATPSASTESLIIPFSSNVITRTGNFTYTSASQLSATMSYTTTAAGLINLVSVSSSAVGDGAWTWSQKSYTTKSLDGGRSLGIYIKGVLTKSEVLNGKIIKTTYDDTVYVEI